MHGGRCFRTSFIGFQTVQVSGWKKNQEKNFCSWQDFEYYCRGAEREGRPEVAPSPAGLHQVPASST